MTASPLYKTAEGEQAVIASYDKVLSQWPVPFETQQVYTRHGNTFVIASGSTTQPALILMHGSGGNSSMWAGDIAAYSQHFRVYAIDLPGEAGKSSPNRPDWTGPAFAEWLEDVLNELHIEQAGLIGISQGAWTALKFAVHAPERVHSLVLMTPGGVIPDRGSFLIRAIGFQLLGKWGLARLVDGLMGDQPLPHTARENIVKTLQVFKTRIGLLPRFSNEELQHLTMPVLLVGGTKDIMRDIPKIETRLRSFVPHLDVAMITGGGHVLIDTIDPILAFLNQLDATEQRQPEAGEHHQI